ncbi:protein RIC-3b [Trematomus bernacchii]|uniref:protein RIC-3b n=1 Tax=Trematomus bernacchii TaxID=40690 RepID=UPI00146D26B9|nr:protein RIC-3b [Trematomus bernacchii]
MAMSMFQKVTLATCLVLCVALLMPKILLSRGRKDGADRPDGAGNFPPKANRQAAPEGRGQKSASSFSRAQNTEANARAKGAGTGAGTGGKSNLAGQIIPVYGFGILLYILYILFKITSKGNNNNNKPPESRFPSVRSENIKRKISDFELSQLQDKLRETEMVMENIVSIANHSSDRVAGVTADQEESLLQQLTEITRVMQEGQLVEEMTPEKKNQEDWEDYPEEPQQQWEHPSHCSCQQHQTEEEAERTQADGADVENLPEDVTNEAEDPNAERESDPAAVRGEEAELQREEVPEHKQGAGGIDLGVPEEELGGVLEELELTLKVTTLMEQEKMDDLSRTTETETSCSSVRRRNKKRRAKKASH